MKRVFIALAIPKKVCKTISDVQKEMQSSLPNAPVRWVREDACHLTLHFLGNQDDEAIQKAIKITKEAAAEAAGLKTVLDGLDNFPNADEPRVIYARLRELDGNKIENMQVKLGRELFKAGFKIDRRKWQAHLTLGRAKGRLNPATWKKIKVPEIVFDISKVELIQSELLPQGPKYTVLATFDLA